MSIDTVDGVSGGAWEGLDAGRPEYARLLDRLEDPRTAASIHTLLDNIELLSVIVRGLDGLARKGEVIGDTLAEVLHEARAAGRATGLDPMETSRQLATLIPTLANASPAINRILESPIVEPEPIDVLSETAIALVKGLKAAQANDTRVGIRGLMKATRDEDVQRGLGFLVEVARVFGADLRTTDGRRGTDAAH
jgi:AcrR family transcriptional regulator